jgi:DNA-binding IclR family transcriptional regulator
MATLAKDEQPSALGGHALQFIEDRRAAKRAADEAKAAAKAADAPPAQAVADKSTPAVAGNVTGVRHSGYRTWHQHQDPGVAGIRVCHHTWLAE